MTAETLAGRKEATVITDLHGNAGLAFPAPHRLQDAPFARLGHNHAVGGVRLHCGGQRLAQSVVTAEGPIIDREALRLEIGKEVAHGRKEKGDLLLVMANVGRLRHHFRAEDHVLLGVQIIERGNPAIELVAKDEAKGLHSPTRSAPRPPSTPMT